MRSFLFKTKSLYLVATKTLLDQTYINHSYNLPVLASFSSSFKVMAMPHVDSHEVEWPAKKVRDTFIKYFEGKNHVNWKSSPVVPHNDPTLLFANAGIEFFFA